MHPSTKHPRTSDRRPWAVVALLCAAQFMLILDITVVNVALPSIQADIGVAVADLPWLITAYTLAFGGLVLLGGRAADRFGRRRMFLVGLAVFTAASLVSAVAAAPAVLIAARAMQGVGAAMLSPAALSLVTTLFPPGPQRHRALAAWAAVAASGGAVGVLVGGGLTEAFGWRAIFLINIPIGAAVAAAVRWLVSADRPAAAGRFTPAAAVLATGSLLALIYGLVGAEAAGWWSARTLGLFALAAAGIALLVRVEGRSRQPLVARHILRRRPVVVALVLFILGMGTVFSGFYYASLYLQQVLGHSALRTGLEFLPVAVVIVATAHLAGHLVARIGAKPVIVTGLLVGAGGALLLSQLSPTGSYATDLLPGFLALGAGGGLAAAGVMITALASAGHDDAGTVSGLTTTAHELGVALVLPVLATVAAARFGGALTPSAPADPGLLTAGFAAAFQAAAAIALGGAVLALIGLRRSDAAAGTPISQMIH